MRYDWFVFNSFATVRFASDQWATARLQPIVDSIQSLSNIRGGFEGSYMKVVGGARACAFVRFELNFFFLD